LPSGTYFFYHNTGRLPPQYGKRFRRWIKRISKWRNKNNEQKYKTEIVQHDNGKIWEIMGKRPEEKNKIEKYLLAFLRDMQYNSKTGIVHKLLNSPEESQPKAVT